MMVNHCSDASSKAPSPQPTAPIRIRSASAAPAMPQAATRMPRVAPLLSASSMVGPGVTITAATAIR